MNVLSLLLFLLSSVAQAQTPSFPPKTAAEAWRAAQAQSLSQTAQWLRLLHFQGSKSQIDGENFFLSPEGRHDAAAELRATIEAFYSPAIPAGQNQHPRCQFRARFLWLAKEIGLDEKQMAPADCSRYEAFKAALGTRSATLIFSSYYLNNPSSAFGHLLLRLNKGAAAQTGERYELLDYGINYAANVDTENPILYAFRGLLGMFKGTYISVPYYYKVREYNDFEARDLWEYELDFTPEEIERLVAHIWELGPTYINYYYLDENCATHILALLDAARPELNLVARLPYFIVFPSDSLHLVGESPNLVRAVHYRPSVRTEFAERLRRLSSDERQELRHLLKRQDPAALSPRLSRESRARVLDAAIDELDYRYAREFILNQGGPREIKGRYLLARAQTGVRGEPLTFDRSFEEPHRGHRASRLGLLGGKDSAGFLEAQIRAGMHDFLDPARGFFASSTLEFLSAGLRYYPQEKNLRLEHFRLMNIESLSEFNGYFQKPSWHFSAGIERTYDGSCLEARACLSHGARAGVGIANFPLRALLVYGMLETELGLGSYGTHNYRMGIGPRLGFRLGGQAWPDFNFAVEGSYLRYLGGGRQDGALLQSHFRWAAARDLAFDLSFLANARREVEARLGAFVYLSL